MTARLIKNVKSLLEVNLLDGESLLQHQLLGQLQRNQLLEPDRVLTPILPSRAMNPTIIEHDGMNFRFNLLPPENKITFGLLKTEK